MFNHVISRFGVPQAIISDHGSHFHNQMMVELSTKLGFHHENWTPYYPRANGQIESINKVLNTMLCRIVRDHKSDWHLILFSTILAYRNSIKKTTCFTPFQLVYRMEVVLPIECEIPSLKLAVVLLPNTCTKEERFLYLLNLDETRICRIG